MGKVNETIRTVNSAVRTLLFAALLLGAGFAGWKGYSLYNEPQEKLAEKQRELDSIQAKLAGAESTVASQRTAIETLEADVAAKAAQVAKLETSNRLLKMRSRIARIKVIEQIQNDSSERPRTRIEFFEVNDDGAPVDEHRQEFTLEGDRVYVECLVAKFDDKYVEEKDLDRGTAICLFQRIFGEYQEPQQGFKIEASRTSPTSYARGGEASEFEKRIWRDFALLENDPQQAAELGVRAAHADAPSIRLKEGGEYELELRSTGEFTLRALRDGR
ncbi:MAG: hypothetical protein KF688_03045 [Pirellulales bacterium]|nr:hypothetical protein [Pirellulales bacterium]